MTDSPFDREARPGEIVLPRDRLWTPDDCARYLGVCQRTFTNRISKRPDFPKPYVETSRRMRRWRPEDVEDYRTKRR